MKLTATRRFILSAMTLLACAAAPGLAQASTVQGFETGDPAVTSIGDAGKVGTFQSDTPTQGSMQFLLTTVGMTSNEDGVPAQSGVFAVGNTTLQSFFHNLSLGGTEGSGVSIPFTVSAGDTQLLFDFDFLSNEIFQSMPRNDFAFAAIFNSANALQGSVNTFASEAGSSFSLFGAQTPFQFHTGYGTLALSLAGLAPGSYTLGLGVEDASTADHASGLLIDNVQVVPEPSVFALALAGAGLLIGVRKRIKRV